MSHFNYEICERFAPIFSTNSRYLTWIMRKGSMNELKLNAFLNSMR
ncbi:hypothetical protein [Leptospira noguchii]|nr:hypothetical protein [Leptospira noguchii]UOG52168.1 hypothetical protein MAL09_16345 [Leptospira noguchii]